MTHITSLEQIIGMPIIKWTLIIFLCMEKEESEIFGDWQ